MANTQNNTTQKLSVDGFTLKIIAIITMLIDHTGAVLFPNIIILRLIGRIAFPIFCFLIVEGYFHTKNLKKYLTRLFIFAFISEIPFDLALINHVGDYKISYLSNLNVFFTLFLGLIVVTIVDKIILNTDEKLLIKILGTCGILLCFIFSIILDTDYSAGGLCLILILYLFKTEQLKRFIFSGLCLYSFFGLVEMTGMLAFLPIGFYNGKRGLKVKYLFYIFYPLHIIILAIIRLYFSK